MGDTQTAAEVMAMAMVRGMGGDTSNPADWKGIMDAWLRVLPTIPTERRGLRINGIEKIKDIRYLVNGMEWEIRDVEYKNGFYRFHLYDRSIVSEDRLKVIHLNCMPNTKGLYGLSIEGYEVGTISHRELSDRHCLARRLRDIIYNIT
jgi:hypothetical protein